MNKAIGPIIFCLLSTALVAVVALSNTTAIKISLLSSTFDFAPGFLALGTFVLGAVSVLSFALIRAGKQITSSKIEGQWEKQDVKLSAEIESDKVKQLEAKITTLEVALKSALTRNKS